MYNLRNYMEEVVQRLLDDVMTDIGVCKCEKCRLDITAIALNNLPGKYFVTEKGELFSKINTLFTQFEVDAITAMTKAALIVKQNPLH